MSQTTDAEAPRGGGWSHPSMPATPKPRPIGITPNQWGLVHVLYDDGTVWQWFPEHKIWSPLPPIPQENGT
jgi:hypothetical protein